jgi:large subunit ribosomal protein L13
MNKETTNLKKEEITRKWYVVDAADKPLGRLASDIAVYLMGKEKPSWTPNQDCGDYIIVINAEKVACSGNNIMTNKKYYNVSGYNGGMRIRTLKEMLEQYPEELMERSVWGMLPKGRLGRAMAKKLFVYKGADHKHEAQKPEVLTFKNLGGKN